MLKIKILLLLLIFTSICAMSQNYIYCYIDLDKGSYSKDVVYGGTNEYNVPRDARILTIYEKEEIKIINEMAQKGWTMPKDIQDGKKLFFRYKID